MRASDTTRRTSPDAHRSRAKGRFKAVGKGGQSFVSFQRGETAARIAERRRWNGITLLFPQVRRLSAPPVDVSCVAAAIPNR